MKWTQDQRRVIDTRHSNILVSAAAGSGKTAVLVARIMDRILDPNDPINIDELLIVTFTKAAAGEMRERITRALADAREKEPDNLHIARQGVLIHNAQITTIDGFCSYVIRNYSHLIDLVAGFRVAEEGEAKLMKSDCCEAVIEAAYAEEDEAKREAFHHFVETFAYGKQDQVLEDMLLQLYAAAESQSDPISWLDGCRADMGAEDKAAFLKTAWMTEYLKDAAELIKMADREAQENKALCEQLDGPSAYLPNATAFCDLTEALLRNSQDYDKVRLLLADFSAPALSRKRPEAGEDPKLRDTYKRNRDRRVKPLIEELQKDYFSFSLDDAFAFQKKSEAALGILINLTKALMTSYETEKRKRNLMDFSDLEHAALRILRKDGRRSYAAKELSERFREVMIDEYQDSNYLQEAILTAVSRIEDGDPNYFCVGDVKQSIYSFRQARPELFMEKYDSYRRTPNQGVRIDLHKNFRSSRAVVDTVNGIFGQIMRREVGGVEYDEDAALVMGADCPDDPSFETEVLPVLVKEEVLEDEESISNMELEARTIGNRIRRMIASQKVYDAETKTMRPAQYRDIVILLRTTKVWADTFVRILSGMRIPAYSETKEGYFEALEVETVLNYLSIVDNPQQDIPLTAVLKSPFVSLNADELAKVRIFKAATSWTGSRDRDAISMYEAARAYVRGGEDAALREKLTEFFALYDVIRSEVHSTPLHELIYRIVYESGYADYAAALPAGSQRVLNLRMLIDKAIAYENTSYVGLFNFVRYINQMKSREIDFGELSAIRENDNVVRIYSIHKSKGLEYPIVFVAGMTKKFNLRDLNQPVLTHPDLGIASDFVDYEMRVKAPTMKKLAIRNRKLKDSIGEELRVLYVALTRAKQKLILTAAVKDEEALNDLYLDLPLKEKQFSTGYLMSVRNYTNWIIPAVRRMIRKAELSQEKSCVSIYPVKPSELAAEEVGDEVHRAELLRTLRMLRSDVVYDEKMRRLIADRFSFQYPHAGGESVPVEISVSELKEMSYQDRDEEFSEESNMAFLYDEETEESCVPSFIKEMQMKAAAQEEEKVKVAPTARGSIYHKAMELLSFAPLQKLGGKALYAALCRQLEAMQEKGYLTAEETSVIRIYDLIKFVESDLGRRLAAAQIRGELYREQPFVLGVDAAQINEEWPQEEMVFVQGMIDAFFYEGENIILVDYKTDYVKTKEELAEKYKVQTQQYAKALSRVTGRSVSEIYLWSFGLGEAIAEKPSGS